MSPLLKEVLTSLRSLGDEFGLDGVRQVHQFLRRNFPRDSVTFVSVLYADLDDLRKKMAREAPHFAWADGKHLSEVQISNHIKAVLEAQAQNRLVTAEEGSRGHVDLTVKHARLGVVWLGEAKIYNSDSYLWGGVLQLHTRYASGFEPDVGLLIYHFKTAAQDAVKQWRSYVVATSEIPCKAHEDDTPFSFFTEHEHAGTQNTLRTRHMVFPLYFVPEK